MPQLTPHPRTPALPARVLPARAQAAPPQCLLPGASWASSLQFLPQLPNRAVPQASQRSHPTSCPCLAQSPTLTLPCPGVSLLHKTHTLLGRILPATLPGGARHPQKPCLPMPSPSTVLIHPLVVTVSQIPAGQDTRAQSKVASRLCPWPFTERQENEMPGPHQEQNCDLRNWHSSHDSEVGTHRGLMYKATREAPADDMVGPRHTGGSWRANPEAAYLTCTCQVPCSCE